jgi:GntR family transcriptional repressor for pyruvate dehydrogenase complex
LPEEITDQLLELIISGGFPDNRLPSERVLCERLDVSRGSVREAVSTLHHLGVIEMRGKVRFGRPDRALIQVVARSPGVEDERTLVGDPMEARRILEPETAALAAERGSQEALNEIGSWLSRMEEAARDDEGSLVAYDSAFHISIAKATGNDTLVRLVAALTENPSRGRAFSFRPPEGIERSVSGHREILEAIRSHDRERARRAMDAHLDQVEELIRLTLSQDR